jgi:hypothetical protein
MTGQIMGEAECDDESGMELVQYRYQWRVLVFNLRVLLPHCIVSLYEGSHCPVYFMLYYSYPLDTGGSFPGGKVTGT